MVHQIVRSLECQQTPDAGPDVGATVLANAERSTERPTLPTSLGATRTDCNSVGPKRLGVQRGHHLLDGRHRGCLPCRSPIPYAATEELR